MIILVFCLVELPIFIANFQELVHPEQALVVTLNNDCVGVRAYLSGGRRRPWLADRRGMTGEAVGYHLNAYCLAPRRLSPAPDTKCHYLLSSHPQTSYCFAAWSHIIHILRCNFLLGLSFPFFPLPSELVPPAQPLPWYTVGKTMGRLYWHAETIN